MLPIQIVRRASAITAMLVLSTVTTAAQVHFYIAPAPSVSNTKDCLSPSKSCATFQRAVDRCPPSRGVCNILAAPGVYSQKTNVSYYKLISIFPLYYNGNCTDRS